MERRSPDMSGQYDGTDGHRVHAVLRLYVAASAPNSLRARANLEAIVREYLDERSTIEVVDVIDEPLRALEDGILVTPTLVKTSPGPAATLIGNLSERPAILLALGIGKGAL
jgi:circadian clock protein KaiB